MIGSNRVRTRPFTRLQEHALATKHELPLTTANSNYVQLFYNQAEYSLGLYERASDVEPRFIAKLRDASIVNNTTEKGPCLFLICKNGHFEFQTTGKEMFSDWLQTFKDCGIPLIPFSQLYKVQKSVGEGSFAKVGLRSVMFWFVSCATSACTVHGLSLLRYCITLCMFSLNPDSSSCGSVHSILNVHPLVIRYYT
eukprot:Lankesteria_metandrocarpae@DN5427_c1_g1_i1.p1